MGRRKQRRLAALSAAGRRVKLDLSAEPTGEMDNTSIQENAGVDPDMEKKAGVPTSPSSSGQKPDLLLLLGQYSDDEAPDSASNSGKLSGSDSPDENNDKVPETDDLTADNKSDDIKNETDGGNLGVDQREADDNQDDTTRARNTNNSSPITNSEVEPTMLPVPEVSDTQPIGDLTDEWKMVLHEESNRYYYWNTQTGETSWNVPEDLNNHVVATEPEPIADGSTLSTTYAPNDASVCVASEFAIGNSDSSKVPVLDEFTVTPGSCVHHFTSYSEQLFHSQGVCSDDHSLSFMGSYEMTHGGSSSLLELCEGLLQRLRTVERSSNLHEWSSKMVLEAEIRLADCKALAPFGSSLLPFWSYTEQRLKDIESSMEQKFSEVKIQHGESEVDRDLSVCRDGHPSIENGAVGIGSSSLSHIPAPAVDVFKKKTENDEKVVTESNNIQPGSPSIIPEDGQMDMTLKRDESPISTQLILKEDMHAAADVDMDVEMEVDDEIPSSYSACDTSNSHCPTSIELPSSQPEPSPAEQIAVPPPPTEEWIPPPPLEPYPPPPPETEPVPPPPPETEPVPPPETEPIPPPIPEEAPIPPPYTDTVHAYPYSDQYGIDYSTAYQYYATVSEAHGTSYYSHADLSNVANPQLPQYYDALAHQSYSSSVTAVPIEPVVYYSYDAHGGAVPVATVNNAIDSSLSYGESMSTGISGSAVSDYNESVKFSAKNDDVELPSLKHGNTINLESRDTENDNIQVTSDLATSQPNAIDQSDNLHSASTNINKNPAKVVRTKKRAVSVATSLRSNKKVSSLVDKWKAAKEELHGNEDDEAQDAYEILEKKRKKEIENWHARQIASGEAQVNANFLPLGGDWRERVKRKRAGSAELVQPPSEDDKKEKHHPDLVELSRGLPPGWQAYWDESSKEVYYGNLQTSVTTWTRPSK